MCFIISKYIFNVAVLYISKKNAIVESMPFLQ